MPERDLDVVVFGATGVTGRLVAAYLAQRAEAAGARWAAAARNRDKLEGILAEDGVQDAELIEADLGDADSLAAMASRAKTVLNMVGPYTLYARPVIEACVAGGAHYMDLTGEIPFVRRVIDEFDERAKEAGVKVVQVSGFEALPPDLAVLLATETARERWDEGLAQADLEVTTAPPGLPRPSDVLSGGTLQSMAAITGDDNAGAATDPAALVDAASAELVRVRSPIELAPRRGDGGAVIAPMTPGRLHQPGGDPALGRAAGGRGGEALPAVPLPRGSRHPRARPRRCRCATRPPARSRPHRRRWPPRSARRPQIRRRVGDAMSSLLPGSGFGPKGEGMEDWKWGLTVDALTVGGHTVRVDLDADGHPGYLGTGRMLGEAGLLLAEADGTPKRSGCLTPATALGTGSLPRFEHAGMRFSVS